MICRHALVQENNFITLNTMLLCILFLTAIIWANLIIIIGFAKTFPKFFPKFDSRCTWQPKWSENCTAFKKEGGGVWHGMIMITDSMGFLWLPSEAIKKHPLNLWSWSYPTLGGGTVVSGPTWTNLVPNRNVIFFLKKRFLWPNKGF